MNDYEEYDEEPEYREFKPAFSLARYGTVLSLSCNQDFAKRLTSIMCDLERPDKDIVSLTKQMKFLLDMDGEHQKSSAFLCTKFGHVYCLNMQRDLAVKLDTVLNDFLANNRISPALYSFCKQLNGYLYPQRFADDY